LQPKCYEVQLGSNAEASLRVVADFQREALPRLRDVRTALSFSVERGNTSCRGRVRFFLPVTAWLPSMSAVEAVSCCGRSTPITKRPPSDTARFLRVGLTVAIASRRPPDELPPTDDRRCLPAGQLAIVLSAERR